MISPIEKKCCEQCNVTKEAAKFYKSSDAFCLNSDCSCHSTIEKNDAEIERIVEEWREGITDAPEVVEAVVDQLRTTLTTFKAHIEAALLEDVRNRVAEVMRDALGLRTVAHYKQESNDYIRGASDQYLADRELVENLQATIIALITKHKEQI